MVVGRAHGTEGMLLNFGTGEASSRKQSRLAGKTVVVGRLLKVHKQWFLVRLEISKQANTISDERQATHSENKGQRSLHSTSRPFGRP
jgi:hypothetical protein